MPVMSTPEAENEHSKCSASSSDIGTSLGFTSINHRPNNTIRASPDPAVDEYPSPSSTRKQSPAPTSAPSSRLPEPNGEKSTDPASHPLIAPFKYLAYEKEQLVSSKRLSTQEQQELAAKLVEFRVRALHSNQVIGEGSHINARALTIPYSGKGSKQASWERTGRKKLEVLQYSFTLPSDGRSFTVMWDYQIGLVRIRPFFAAVSLHDKKTRPQAALDQNPGLADLTYHLTGGSIKAQGYWMPFACARAVCATFCYEIRWALTPIFGAAFLRDCAATFGDYKIEQQIIVNAAREAKVWIQDVSQLPQCHDSAQSRNTLEETEEQRERPSREKLTTSTAIETIPDVRPKLKRSISATTPLEHTESASTRDNLFAPELLGESRRRSCGTSARKRSASSDGRISQKKRRLSADDVNMLAAKTLLDLAREPASC